MEEAWGTLTISYDKMTASIQLNKPAEGDRHTVTEEMVRKMLWEAGVKLQPEQEAVNRLLNSAHYGESVELVHGKAPVKGNDGFYTFTRPMEDMRAKPVINDDGTADYKNSLKLAMVRAGEVFAFYTRSTPGQYGYDVFQGMVAPPKGKELPPLRGPGVNFDEEKQEYSAAYDGHIIYNGYSIKIEKLYSINGDLDLSVGNIEFDGDIEVTGDMRSGLSIKAGGSVYIHGHVGACLISAGKNITIQKGVQGHDNSLIEAKGDVTCKFVERCSIVADGTITLDSVLNSTIRSKKTVIVNSKNGAVVGSEIHGSLGVVVKEAGNESEITTILQAGVCDEDLSLAAEYTSELIKLDEKMLQLEQHQREFEAISNPSPEVAEMKMKILRAKVVVASEQMQIHTVLDPLSELIADAKRESTVKVTGIAHAGLGIIVNGARYRVYESVKDVVFRESCDQVIMESA